MTMAPEAGESATDAIVGVFGGAAVMAMMLAALVTPLHTAVTLLLPAERPVTTPVLFTVAIEGALLFQAVAGHVCVVWLEYMAIETSCCDAPATMVPVAGVKTTAVTVGVTGGGAVTVVTLAALWTLLQTAVTLLVPAAIALTRPEPFTVAVPGDVLSHELGVQALVEPSE